MSKKVVTLEIGFQDTEVPIYTSFENIRSGLAILYGTNKKNIGSRYLIFPTTGVITDKNGVEIEYTPTSKFAGFVNRMKRMSALPLNMPIWLLGKYKDMIFVHECGKKEEFKYPNLLE